jgi:hypothetical protein
MAATVIRKDVVPFFLALAALATAALLLDAALHLSNAVWIGRYLGIPGVLLIVGSFAYSLRKRGVLRVGRPLVLLRLHEGMAWLGSLLVLVHAGIHFNAILPWLAVWAMLVNVASGLTGKFLLARARRRLEAERSQLRADGLTEVMREERLHWDSMTFDAVRQWRIVHFPITLAFGVLALAHLLAVFLFWGWR